MKDLEDKEEVLICEDTQVVILYTACIKCMAVHFYTCLVSSSPIVQDMDFYAHKRINVV